ncbi:MAG: hydrogenase maturation nickel metallochaperone HypA [Desulfuromonas sp.]|nr:MAG: hydrogenase maturation nickel metallochaperone HypA [Desulfuromonas sp.]
MHELGIAQSIVEIAEKNARQQGAKRVLTVTVEVGVLAGVLPEALEFCFDACCRETLLEGSRLRIQQIPARARCRDCHQEYELKSFFDNCPACDSTVGDQLSGEELRIKEMEID